MHTLGNPAAAGTNVLVLDPKAKNQPVATATGPSVRTIARQQNIDLPKLLEILSHRRPEGSDTEEQFVKDFLDPIEGMQRDKFGNRYIRVGTAPVMWSCHTDTVSDEGGMQNIKWRGDTLELNEPKLGQSLGADDGAGLWLLLEMLKAGREGLYIFHREEEVGGIGSKWIAKNTPELVKDITMAIAFDRKGTSSVITRQRGRRCCSDKFGQALADKLSQTDGLTMKLDPTGVFTDTASYTTLIAECTNISTGYYDEHSDRETLDVAHLLRLREALLTLDVTNLPVERDPTEQDYDSWGGYGRSYGSYGGFGRGSSWNTRDTSPLGRIEQLVKERPHSIAKIFHNMGLTPFALEQMITNVWQRDAAPTLTATPKSNDDSEWRGALADNLRQRGIVDPDEDGEDVLELDHRTEWVDMLFCNTCQEFDASDSQLGGPRDGDYCSSCYQNDTEVMEVEVDAVSGELIE